jgi:hypothetical protein
MAEETAAATAAPTTNGKMTLNKALKTRAIVDKRIDKAQQRVRELACHLSNLRPAYDDQKGVINRLMQSIDDLYAYKSRLNAAIMKANLETPIVWKGKTFTLHEVLDYRGPGRRRNGFLSHQQEFIRDVKRALEQGEQELKMHHMGAEKERSTLELVTHVDVATLNEKFDELVDFEGDIDILIEEANFRTEIDLEDPPK